MTLKEKFQQVACDALDAGKPVQDMADAVAVVVLREAKERLRSKLTPYASYQMAANILDALLAECAPAVDVKAWIAQPGQIKTSDSNRDVLEELSKLPAPATPPAPSPSDVLARPEIKAALVEVSDWLPLLTAAAHDSIGCRIAIYRKLTALLTLTVTLAQEKT